MNDEMPTSRAEWEAHRAFYKLTVAQRDAAWREIETLKERLATPPDATAKLIEAALAWDEEPGDTELCFRLSEEIHNYKHDRYLATQSEAKRYD